MKTQFKRVSKSTQRGASLLESIAFLGVAAIVILGAVALLMSSFGSANTNRAQQEVTSIRTGVKKLYMGQSASYGDGDMNGTLVNARVFPTTLAVDTSGVVLNAWNGAVSVTGATANFTITYANVPRDVCVNLASVSGDWIGVNVNGTDLSMPATPAQADANCRDGGNTLAWTAG
jgi:type II secretory pathway pseudopilin PulG